MKVLLYDKNVMFSDSENMRHRNAFENMEFCSETSYKGLYKVE